MSTSNKKLAVLIDADNAPADIIDEMLEEIAKYGVASVKRIYGDWSHGLSKWKATLLPHAIIPVQQFAYTKGKNATDMALVIDAMDLLYSGNFDGFCIVSSDSDFTRLASRLRESGLTVYGFGEKKTPESFRRACDKFVYVEIFRPEKNLPKQKNAPNQNNKSNNNQELINLIKRAVKETADDLGWANLAPIGSYINKVNPDFDSRLYGFSKLSDLIKSLDLFEHRTDNNQLQVRRLNKNETQRVLTDESPKQSHFESSSSQKDSNNMQSSENSEKNTSGSLKKKSAKNKPNHAPQNSNSEFSGSLKDSNNVQSSENTEKNTSGSLKKKSAKNKPNHAPQNPNPESSGSLKDSNNVQSSDNPEKNTSGSLKNNKPNFSKIIPIVQNAIDACADPKGWARLGEVLKYLELHIQATQYGFDNTRDLIHSIYDDWLEIKKLGRGERIRINKRFISKNE